MQTDDLLQLQEPVAAAGAIRAVNGFNGRLLTGGDLTRLQEARRTGDSHLGLALGDGVAFGLDVVEHPDLSSAAAPVLRIAPGLALNRLGQALRLEHETGVALTRRFESPIPATLFEPCNPIAAGTYVAGAGVYVLTIAPASLPEGRAQSNGLDPAAVRCNIDATVEALQFRLLPIEPRHYADLDLGSPQLRNRLAYRCFGPGVQPARLADVFGAGPRDDGLLETLRPAPLGDADVPLALLYIAGSAEIRFIDTWSVRRSPAQRYHDGPLPALAEPRRIAIGQAMFNQFHAQAANWATPSGLGAVTARSHCRFLPPVGIIPVPEEAEVGDARARAFFAGMSHRGPAFINAARLEGLIRDSFAYPPVDTTSDELLWLYRVRENRMAIELAGGGSAPPRSYLVFASGHLPYIADGQYDLGYWDYSNYALARGVTA